MYNEQELQYHNLLQKVLERGKEKYGKQNMNIHEEKYNNLIINILNNGVEKDDRTGTGTISLFCPPRMDFFIDDGKQFPLFTKKYVNFNVIVKELLWFLSGSCNVNDLDSNIWEQWTDEYGSIGNLYGKHFRDINGEDPFMSLIDNIKKDPHSRRHCMSSWRIEFLPISGLSFSDNIKLKRGALAPCHLTALQVYVNGDYIDLYTYQRSCDVMLGGFFNIPSYALLLMIIAKMTGYKAGTLYYQMGDTHIYKNHRKGMEEYVSRDFLYDSPKVIVHSNYTIPVIDEIELIGYKFQPKIKLPIAI